MSDEKQKSPEEQGFNDSELQDIMEEIESLEKEFTGDSPEPKETVDKPETPSAEQGEQTDLQKAIDKEVKDLEMEANMDQMEQALDKAEDQSGEESSTNQKDQEAFSDEDFEEPETTNNVTPITSSPTSGHMQLKASNLELCFPVGAQKAHFKVLPEGFSVEMNGMIVQIDEKKGCHISMPGGAQFSLPFTPDQVKKAS